MNNSNSLLTLRKKTLLRGQTLIEVLVAVTAIAVIAVAVSYAVTLTLSDAEFSTQQSMATKYAQEGMEILISLRDSSYANFKTYSGTYCLNSGAITLSPNTCTSPNIAGSFIRTITVNQNPGCDPNDTQVTVSVSWKDSKCSQGTYCHASTLVSCLSHVNPVTGP